MLMVCPELGRVMSAADGIVRFMNTLGVRQGSSSSPVRMRVGVVSARIRSSRS